MFRRVVYLAKFGGYQLSKIFLASVGIWVLSPKPADYTVVDYKDEREDDLYM